MTEEQEINNIAEIIWKHIYASCKYDWYSSNDNEYYPVNWAATEIYKLFNPDNTKVKLIINKNNITVERPHRKLDWFIWYKNR